MLTNHLSFYCFAVHITFYGSWVVFAGLVISDGLSDRYSNRSIEQHSKTRSTGLYSLSKGEKQVRRRGKIESLELLLSYLFLSFYLHV